jgi:SAM-dependent methyltransferase
MDFENFDFIDFGCSTGGNVEFVKRVVPNIKGLGIDIDPKKVEGAKARGIEAITLDILTIESRKLVEFVTMSHFLEHLDSPREAEKFIRKAVDISRSFVHIRQPFFDGDGYLLELGLKCYWSDWRGHPNNMKMLDFYKIGIKLLNRGLIHSFSIYGRIRIHDATDECIVPLGAPMDSGKYNESFGKKNNVIFPHSLFRETVMEICVSSVDAPERIMKMHRSLAAKGEMCLIFNSTRNTDSSLPAR